MSTEKRRGVRRIIAHGAMILNPDGSVLSPCTIMDVSATGARLKLQMPGQVPDDFTLLLSRNAKVRRKCETVWQSDTAIGVRFIIEHPSKFPRP
jgi:hypothetical protein